MHRKSLVIPLLLLASAAAARTAGGDGPAPDTETADTVIVVDKVQVTAIKQGLVLRSQPVAASIVGGRAIERGRIGAVKNLSQTVPNFHAPDYGSRMTSSIYVRGLGARIDQPVIGLNIDNVPVLNKDNFDTELADAERIEVLRGPQSTLYGRNTMGGVVNVYTLSPLTYEGVRLTAEYGSGDSYRFRASSYYKLSPDLGMAVTGYFTHTGGFFDNDCTGEKCDWERLGGGRWKTQWRNNRGVRIDNTFSFSALDQGGYPYAYAGEDIVRDGKTVIRNGQISYNDPSSYRRTTVSDGLTVRYDAAKYSVSSITSYQYSDDEMTLDQDFTPESWFTLRQARREHALTEDIVFRSHDGRRYGWLLGAFGFYRIAADQAENLLEVMKQLLKDPEANKELLAPHKVDTSDYEKKVQEEMAAQQTEKQEPQKQENMEQRKEQQQDKSEQMQGKRGYQPIDESKINWQELEDRWGVKRDNLEKSGDLTKMLNYGKSDLVKVKPTFGGESFELDARLSFKKDGEGNISLVPHFIRKEQKLDEYKEHKFSDNDRKNLRETGNLGRVVDIVDRETGEIIPSYISIDRKTNEITDIPASRVRIPERIGKTEITTQERDMLRAGLPVRDKLIERNDGRKFVTTLQVNVEQRGVEFVPGTGRSPRTVQTQETKGDTSKSQAQGGENATQTKKEQRRNTWTNEDGSIRPISKWSDVNFTEQQKADYVAGKAVKLENVTDKQGFHATMYIKFNPEKGRPYRYDTNPDNAQQVAPSNESRTQVAVNNDGKTNEATKNLREPLQKGQTNPKDARQQQQQEKPQKKTGKGMKM